MPNVYILETDLGDPNTYYDTEIYESWLPVNNAEYCVVEDLEDSKDLFSQFYAKVMPHKSVYKIDISELIKSIDTMFKNFKDDLLKVSKTGFKKYGDFLHLEDILAPFRRDLFIYEYGDYMLPYELYYNLKPDLEKLLKEGEELYLIQVFRYKI